MGKVGVLTTELAAAPAGRVWVSEAELAAAVARGLGRGFGGTTGSEAADTFDGLNWAWPG